MLCERSLEAEGAGDEQGRPWALVLVPAWVSVGPDGRVQFRCLSCEPDGLILPPQIGAPA